VGSVTGTAPAKETKSQRIERLKRQKNPWACLQEIRDFARKGREAVLPEWTGAYLRWWGIYTQGDGAGVVGGKGGEGKSSEYFMMRIRLPNGHLRSRQLMAIAGLAERYARSIGDITVRQNIQLHWLPVDALPVVIEELAANGLTPRGACGDVVRNITGCPLSGLDAEEICDASPLVLEADKLLSGNADFYNLPRKFKVSITGCPVWCTYPEINDVGLTAVARLLRGRWETGYSLRVGGGLSADPHLAVRLNAFVREKQVLAVVRCVAEIFREQDSLRQSRDHARLKHMFTQQGWTPDRFLEELNLRLDAPLEPAAEEHPPEDVYRDHVGINPQKQAGLYYVGAAVLRGRITAQQMRVAAELSERYATGELRTTSMQNLILVNVPHSNIEMLAEGLLGAGLPVHGSPFARGAIACTGTEFCKIAITETKGFARWLIEELEDRLPGFDQQLKIHVAGCPNSCGQHWIADIGLEGKKIKGQEGLIDAYYFCLGGAVGMHQQIARPVGYRCPAGDVPAAIERLLRAYLTDRIPGENLRAYFARCSDESLRTLLAGGMIEAVSRDPSPGPVPRSAGE
jgi:sulfite reductase (ferredoxin)